MRRAKVRVFDGGLPASPIIVTDCIAKDCSMDSFEWNKIIGATLGTVLFIVALYIFVGGLMEPHKAEKPGMEVAVTEDAGHGTGETPVAELPPDVVRIDRGSPWGNQYKIGDPFPSKLRRSDPSLNGLRMNRADVLALYRDWLERRLEVEPDYLEPLRGKRLAC